MKFSVQRDQFIRILSRAQGVVEKKSTIAVLSHVLIETVDKEAIKLTCTDYDVVLMDSCPAQVEQEGKAVVSGKLLYDIIKVLPSVDVSFEKADEERINLEAGKSKYRLSGFDPDDFPRIEKEDKEPAFTMPISAFRRMIAKTAFCMSNEEARMNLNGILFDLRAEEKGMTFICVATDGHRLAKVEHFLEGKEIPTDIEGGVIVHRKGVHEVRKILDTETGDVSIGFSSGEVVFRAGNAALFVREIDEEYPDYESVVPDSFDNQTTVDTAELIEGMGRVLPLTDPTILTVKLTLKPEAVMLSAANAQNGAGETTVFAEYDGEEREIGFNHRYLLDSASAIEAPQLYLRVSQPGAPCLLVPAEENEKALYVLMPIDEV